MARIGTWLGSIDGWDLHSDPSEILEIRRLVGLEPRRADARFDFDGYDHWHCIGH